jgi:hypothetical protein
MIICMEFANCFLVRVCVCAGLLFFPLSALSDNTTMHSRFAGVYLSHFRDGLKTSFMNLSLGQDGTATVTEDPGDGTLTFFGHWSESGNQVMVTFDSADGKPPEQPMAFQPAHDGLQAVTWNHAVWGKDNPPPMKKGFKVKEKYWLTTNP